MQQLLIWVKHYQTNKKNEPPHHVQWLFNPHIKGANICF